MVLLALLDKKSGEYGPVLTVVNEAIGIRHLGDLRNGGTPVDKYPQDFDLVCLGGYDPQSGVIQAFPVPRFVMNVGEYFGSIALVREG